MEEDNDLEQVTGSPTAGDNEFVHIESADSAPDEVSINQVDSLEQDDGVVVTGADTVLQPERQDVIRTTEPDEFVDAPDDLVSSASSAAISPVSGNRVRQQPFAIQPAAINAEIMQIKEPDIEKEVIPQVLEEERTAVMEEVSHLHHQLKNLSRQPSLIERNEAGLSSEQITSETVEGGEKTLLSLPEMVNECSKFIELSLNERVHSEDTIKELNDALNIKNKEIEDLKANEMSSVEATADRILSSFATFLGDTELSDTSLNGKLSHLEKVTTLLLQQHHHFLSEAQMLNSCLVEIKPDFQMQNGMGELFMSVREELVGLKRKEFELVGKNSHLEFQHGQVMEQLDKNRETVELLNAEMGQLKAEVEQERIRYTNSKEKLSMAVTKGKALVQQRDSLKQSVAEKTAELERCLTELQEKSTALEASELRNTELMMTQNLAKSLQEALSQRDMVLQKCGEFLSLNVHSGELNPSDIIERVAWLANEVTRLSSLSWEFQRLTELLSFLQIPDVTQFPTLESQISWLLESYNLEKYNSVQLQNQIDATKEAAHAQIDRLTATLLAESQEKHYLIEEFEDLRCKYENVLGENEKIKEEQAITSTESSSIDKESLEKIQNLLYVRDQEANLYEQILEEEKMYRLELIKVSEELNASKDEKNSLQVNFQRAEEKASLVREKLSLAVKKGKGLVQERESMKQQMAEKNAQIESLTLELQKKESTLIEYKDQINTLSTKVEKITKLESDLLQLKQERDQIEQFLIQSNTILQQVIETIDGIVLPVDIRDPVEKVKWFATYLTKTLTTMKSLEDALSVSEKNVSQLSEQKRELETSNSYLTEELQKVMEELKVSKTDSDQEIQILQEEISTLNTKLIEALKTLKSVEDSLTGSEKTITQLTEEKAAAEMELQKVKLEVSDHAINLDEAHQIIKSLQDALSQLKTNVSQSSQENEKTLLNNRNVLESEIKKLKQEIVDSSVTIQTLEDALSSAEQKISTLNTELNTCRQELVSKHDKWASEVSGFFGNLQVVLKDGSMLSLFKQSFEKKVERLKEMDQILNDTKDKFDSEQLQDHPALKASFRSTFLPVDFDNDWNSGMFGDKFNTTEDSFSSNAVKTLENINTKNQILSDQFTSFSTTIDEMIASLLKKLETISNTVPDMLKQTKTLQQNSNSTIEELKVELEKTRSMYDKADEENDVLQRRVFELETDLEASGNTCNEMSSKLEDYQAKENKWRELEAELSVQNTRFQERVSKLENDLEASGNQCDEMSSKLEDYRGKEDKWNEREREFSLLSTTSVKDHDGDDENALLSASQIKSLFDKIDGITIPFTNLVSRDTYLQDSDPVKKLFYIIDNINELLELNSTLSKQTLEIEHLKEEFKESMKYKQESEKTERELFELSVGLQSIIQKLGGDEFVGVKKSADVAGLVPLLERLVQDILLDSENSRFRVVETQRVAEELANKVKFLEESFQKRTSGSDTIQEKGVFASPSLSVKSEISEIEDQVPVGKVGLPLVPSAAHVRSLRKNSSDQLAINIDSETDRLLGKTETVADKGHVFKSLHTSGLVPVRGKMIADRLDGIWVSIGQVLMRQPRARLGLIVYWLFLHLWLIGTIL